MQIAFRRVSNDHHVVEVVRSDGSTDRAVLSSKDFLRHDLAHLALELEVGLAAGVWGSVAQGGRLDGDGLDGDDVAEAELAAGRLQTLMRTDADVAGYEQLLSATMPRRASRELAERLHRRAQALLGHWNATPFGEAMVIDWPE